MPYRLTALPIFDFSLAFITSVASVVIFGLAVNVFRTSDLSMNLLDDEVKVEAARFSVGPDGEMDIFAAGCNAHVEKHSCK